MMTTPVIALLASVPSFSLPDGITAVSASVWAVLGGVLLTVGKTLFRALKEHGGSSQCSQKKCRRITEHEGRFKIIVLAILCVIIFLSLVGMYILGHRAAMAAEEEEALLAEAEEVMRKLVTQEIRATSGLLNVIRALDNAAAGLQEESKNFKAQTKERMEGWHENRPHLAASVQSLISVLSSEATYCRMAEEMAGLSESEDAAAALFRIQRDLILILLPDFHTDAAARAALKPGEKLPTLAEISEDEVYDRRLQAVEKIDQVYLLEIQGLKEVLVNKIKRLKNPDVEAKANIK